MNENLAFILIEYLKGKISYEEVSIIINKNLKKVIEEEIKERFNGTNTSN